MATARWESIDVGGSEMRAFVARPDGDGPLPAVVVNHGLGGVDGAVPQLTEWLADEGYVAAAPEYYHRQTDDLLDRVKDLRPGSPERVQLLRQKVEQLRDDEVIADGRGAVELLRGLAGVDPERVGVVGFCLGGHITYLQATAIADFKAVVPFYPSGLWTAWGGGPSPFERSAGIAAPLLGLFGGEDRNPSPEDAQKLDEQLTRLGKQHEFHSFAGAAHDFQNFRSASYHEQAARDSWGVMVGFLGKHLGA